MTRSAVARSLDLFRQDAARWVRPQQVAAVEEITPSVAMRLLLRHPPLRAMAWFRFAIACRELGIRGASGYVQRRLLRLYGLELAPSTPVGGGLYIAHPVGCVLHARSIGTNVTVISQATFGTRSDAQWPTIGNDVMIGAGARVLGGITIADGTVVGANAVVIHDTQAGAVVAGVPARLVRDGAGARS